jgi:hypothetical protein
MLTRPDLAYNVHQACLYMHDPRELHLALIKRLLRYMKGTLDFELHLSASSASSLTAYSDIDWASCPDTHAPLQGSVYLGDSPPSPPTPTPTGLAARTHTLHFGVLSTSETIWSLGLPNAR